MEHPTTLSALALSAVLALAGCTTGQETAAPATDGASAAAPATDSAGPATAAQASGAAAEIAAEHNEADVMFAQMMIPHHEQAVQMSEILLAKDLVPGDIRDLAGRVVDTQQPEMEQMRAMLAAWDAPDAPDDSAAEHGGHGSGMVDEEGMDQLREAGEGPEAAELYLEQMTVHHEGAIDMAQDQVEDGSNPQAIELAREIVAAQETEIAEMDTMREELSGS